MKTQLLAVAAAAAILAPAAAQASTMPRADFGTSPTLGLGIGWGAGASIDVPVSHAMTLGAGIGLYHFYGADLNARLMYKLTHVDRLTVDLLAGVESVSVASFGFGSVGPFIGVGLAYPLDSRLTLRGNIAVGFLGAGYADADGIELGYKLSPTMEGTIGANGRGDFLGLKLAI